MNALRTSVLTLAALASLAFVPSAQAETSQRGLSGFSKIELKGALDADIREGKGFSVELRADADDLPRIKTHVEGDTLVIETEEHHGWHSRDDISATITLPHFAGLLLSGAGNVKIAGVHAQAVTLDLRGAGDVQFAGEAKRVAVKLKGAGSVTFAPGHAQALDIQLSGAGDIKAKALVARDVSVDLRGTGSVELTADGGALDLGMHGIGSIRWYGTASQVSTSQGGIGSIEHG
jgi:hypothetical protein